MTWEWYQWGAGGLGHKAVGERLARRDGALRHVGHPVHPRAPPLEEAVPVDGQLLTGQHVGYLDGYLQGGKESTVLGYTRTHTYRPTKYYIHYTVGPMHVGPTYISFLNKVVIAVFKLWCGFLRVLRFPPPENWFHHHHFTALI